METVRYIEGEEILAWIRQPGVRSFRYRTNGPGFSFLAILGGIGLLLAGALAWDTRLDHALHVTVFLLLAGAALACYWIIFHWTVFAMRNYVAISPDALLVGRGPRAWIVPKSRLDRTTVRFENLRRSKYSSELPIHIDHHRLRVLMYGPFANLDGLNQFMAEVLEVFLVDDEGEDEAEGIGRDDRENAPTGETSRDRESGS